MTKEFNVRQINKDVLDALNEVFSSYGCPTISHDATAFELRSEVGELPKVVEYRNLFGPAMNEHQ